MAHTKHKIFAFVGASGSGKSTLMIELLSFFPHLEIIKSTSTRARRDETDDLFYKLVDLDYLSNKDLFLNHIEYAGNHYVYEKVILDQTLLSHCGMFAIVEESIPIIREHGYELKLIKVIPDRDWTHERALEREKNDLHRANANDLTFDLIVENSFKTGGLQQTVEIVSKFILDSIADHHSGS